MEIKINVDELKFKDVLEKELNAFSKEELHEIIRECICEYFRNTDTDIIKNLFTERSSYYDSSRVPGKVLHEAARTLNLAPAFEEIQTLMINHLKDNYQDVMQKAMLDVMINGICYNNGFAEAVRETLYRIRAREANN